jgi:hypothetical protein
LSGVFVLHNTGVRTTPPNDVIGKASSHTHSYLRAHLSEVYYLDNLVCNLFFYIFG